MPAAVLDACVLVPAALRDTLLHAAQDRMFAVRWSERILDELTRTLVTGGMTSPEQAARLLRTMRRAFPQAMVDEDRIAPLVESMTNHPKDRHVAAAAVAAHAPLIVTLNARDFPTASLSVLAIEALSPDTFLTSLLATEPARVFNILKRQAAELRRPIVPLDQVLDNLALHVPVFVALVREALLAAE